MKKILNTMLVLMLCIITTTALACSSNEVPDEPNNPPQHQCTWQTEYNFDSTHHWIECEDDSCIKTNNKGSHSFTDGACVVCSYPDPSVPQFCKSHSGAENCSVCGLDYYDELKSILIENGRQGGSAGVKVYDGKVTSGGGGASMSTYVVYDPSEESIKIMAIYDIEIASYTMVITMPHPSESESIKEGKYTWVAGLDIGGSSIGVLNAKTFSKYTEKLYETVTDMSSTTIGSFRSTCAFMAQYAIEDAFLPLLKLGEKGLSAKDFGFANY